MPVALNVTGPLMLRFPATYRFWNEYVRADDVLIVMLPLFTVEGR